MENFNKKLATHSFGGRNIWHTWFFDGQNDQPWWTSPYDEDAWWRHEGITNKSG